MALQKDTNYKGITANYWKILSDRGDFLTGATSVTLGLYYDKAARDANPQNTLDQKFIGLTAMDLTRVQEYDMIKLLPEFTDAQDA